MAKKPTTKKYKRLTIYKSYLRYGWSSQKVSIFTLDDMSEFGYYAHDAEPYVKLSGEGDGGPIYLYLSDLEELADALNNFKKEVDAHRKKKRTRKKNG